MQDHDEQLLEFSASEDEGLSDQSDDENESMLAYNHLTFTHRSVFAIITSTEIMWIFFLSDEDDQIEQEGDEQEDMDNVELEEEEEEEEGKKVTHEMITKWKSGLEVRLNILAFIFEK